MTGPTGFQQADPLTSHTTLFSVPHGMSHEWRGRVHCTEERIINSDQRWVLHDNQLNPTHSGPLHLGATEEALKCLLALNPCVFLGRDEVPCTQSVSVLLTVRAKQIQVVVSMAAFGMDEKIGGSTPLPGLALSRTLQALSVVLINFVVEAERGAGSQGHDGTSLSKAKGLLQQMVTWQ